MAKAKPTTTPKSDLEEQRHEAEKLAMDLAQVLKSPACPQHLYDSIVDSLNEIQSRNDCYNVDFLMGLLLSKPRQVEGRAA
jgi:hypothetical protein